MNLQEYHFNENHDPTVEGMRISQFLSQLIGPTPFKQSVNEINFKTEFKIILYKNLERQNKKIQANLIVNNESFEIGKQEKINNFENLEPLKEWEI